MFILRQVKAVDRIRIFQISIVFHSPNTAVFSKILPVLPGRAVCLLLLDPYCFRLWAGEVNDDAKYLWMDMSIIIEIPGDGYVHYY